MNVKDALTSRSFSHEPFSVLSRGIEWSLRSWLGLAKDYEVEFGPCHFKLALQCMKRGHGSAGIFIQREYYEPLLEFGHKLLHRGDNIIDGGANQGIYACAFASLVGDAGEVYAFEPQHYATDCIRTNLELNHLHNVKVFEAALSDHTGEMYLVLSRGPISAFLAEESRDANKIKVPTFTIDDLFRDHKIQPCQFIKLDVEGAEMSTLTGATSMIEKEKPTICVEALDRKLYGQIENFLNQFAYRPFEFDKQGNLNSFSDYHPSPNVLFLH